MAKHGLRCTVYIEDGICEARTEAECVAAKDTIISALGEAGFILKIPKCVLNLCMCPVKRFLGFNL